MWMRRLLALIVLGAVVATVMPARAADTDRPWSASDIASLNRDVAGILDAPTLRGAHVGLLATDAKRGTQLIARNADDAFQPASTFKLLVGSAALDNLGSTYAFHTSVYADGAILDGTLHGNLYLRGGGDVHLSAKDLDDAAAAVSAAGIVRVDGTILSDATHFDDERYPPGWNIDDIPYDYAAVTSALSFDENVLHMYLTPGAHVGDPAIVRIDPASTGIVIENRLITGPPKSNDTSDILRPWNAPMTIRVTGSYPIDAKESDDVAPAVPDPAGYALSAFTAALARRGIAATGGSHDGDATPATATHIWTHASEPLARYLGDMWLPSDNLAAELLLKELGTTSAMPGTRVAGIGVEQRWLRHLGIEPADVAISDGSGLSNYDRIEPRTLVAILQHDWNGPNRAMVLAALPVAGRTGTLRYAFKGTSAEGRVIAKTGTVDHVRTLSGYIATKHHGMVTFSLMIEDWIDPSPEAAQRLATVRGALLSRFVDR